MCFQHTNWSEVNCSMRKKWIFNCRMFTMVVDALWDFIMLHHWIRFMQSWFMSIEIFWKFLLQLQCCCVYCSQYRFFFLAVTDCINWVSVNECIGVFVTCHSISFRWSAALNVMALVELLNTFSLSFSTFSSWNFWANVHYKKYFTFVSKLSQLWIVKNNIQTNTHFTKWNINMVEREHLLIFLTQQTIWIIVGFAQIKNYFFSKANLTSIVRMQIAFFFFFSFRDFI